MPKLDGTHLPQRIADRLADLKAGEEVAARDIKALLNDEQIAAMEAAWVEQQALRKVKRARTKEEERELGWKTKREIHIEAYVRALADAEDRVLEEHERLQTAAMRRQMRIYMDTMTEALKAGKDEQVAKNAANNALTRAALTGIDGQKAGFQSRRDKEVWEMEQQILQRKEAEMTTEEREQLELLREHEKAVLENRKKRGW